MLLLASFFFVPDMNTGRGVALETFLKYSFGDTDFQIYILVCMDVARIRWGGGVGCSLQDRMSQEYMLLAHEREFLKISMRRNIFTHFVFTCKMQFIN